MQKERNSSADLISSANEFCNAGNFEAAETVCTGILKSDPGNAAAYNCLGDVFSGRGEAERAIGCYRKAIELNTDYPGTYYNLAALLQKKGDLGEALTLYRRAAALNPGHADTYNNIGEILREQRQFDEAIGYYQKALRLAPDSPLALNNLGSVCHELGDLDEAMTLYQRAIQLNPRFAGSYYNLGVVFHSRKRFQEALACYQKTIELDPDFADAYFNISSILLLLGNFRDGFRLYEWRWRMGGSVQRSFPRPEWRGSDISRMTILLHAEQGFGDAIQFIRYAPLVAGRGAKVFIECRKELASLFKTVGGAAEVVVYGERLPQFDLHCPLMSLPLIFGTTPDSVPSSVPYLRADAGAVRKWEERLRTGDKSLKIGLAWSGRAGTRLESERSCPLNLLLPLAGLKGTAFYSLQKGEAASRVGSLLSDANIADYTDEMVDFSETAAFMENLDLVISVDTAVAHLAGALGKPVLTLLPSLPDWRWMLDRDDSPWYPTMRLFRQPSAGDWASVVREVSLYLGKRIADEG